MKTKARILTLILMLAMLVSIVSIVSMPTFAADGTWTLVTNASDLKAGDKVIIVAKDYNYALSTTQNNNNRGQVAITKSSDKKTINSISASVQQLTLQTGKKDGTFAFYTGSGYLYAASSGSNYLKTETKLSDNSSWTIAITNAGVATIKAQGSNTRNVMQYNQSSSLFACYGSASQKAVCIYKLVASNEPDTPACTHTNKVAIGTAKAATCTVAGMTAGEKCADCSQVITAQKEIPALGHNYVNKVCSVCGEKQPNEVTVTTKISDYATSENWNNGTKYTSFKMDDYINVSVSGGDNTGRYYTSGTEWRLYQTESAKLTIKAAEGATIVSVKITYNVSNTGTLVYNGSNVTSGNTVSVNDTSITFSVGNTGTAKNGQVKITAIEVIYKFETACSHANTTTETVAATCTTAGSTTETCDACGHVVNSSTTDALGHHYVGGICDREGCGHVMPNYSGKYYIATIRTSGNYFYMTNGLGDANTERYQAVDTGLTTLPAKITSAESEKIFVLEANDDGTYYIYAEGIDEDEKYLGWTSGNSGTLVAKADALKLTVDFNGTTYNIHYNDGTDERYLSLNGNSGSDYFAFYAGTQKQDLSLIPVECTHQYDNACDAECNVCHEEREVSDHVYTNDCDTTCNECGATRTITHTYDNACDTKCNVCEETREVSDHVYTNTCDTTCNVCNAERTITHTYDNACDTTCNVCNAERTITHTPGAAVEENKVDSTCSAEGSYDSVVKCSVCGEEISRTTETIAKKEHTPGAAVEENKVDSTCSAEGSYDSVVKCSVCGEEISRTTKTIAKKEHTPGAAVEENKVDSTCSAEGSYDSVVKCSVCGEEISRTTKTIAKKEHTPGTAVEENKVDSTCSAEGSYDSVVKCSVCGEEISRTTETIAKKEHTPGTAVEENKVDSTCSKEGSYDSVVKCSVCGKEISRTTETIAKKEHTPGTAVEENRVESTCTEAGHYDSVVYCSVCKTHEISRETKTLELAAHTPGTAADCENAQTCTVCGDELAPATGHKDEGKDHVCDNGCNVVQGDHKEQEDSHICEYCGKSAGECIAGKPIIENSTAATCGQPGSYDEVIYCTICGDKLNSTHHTVDALPHSYDETITKAPTCEDAGYKTLICSVCGDTKTEEIAALGHKIITVEAKDPTCTTIGWNAYEKCSVCDYTTYVELGVIPHDYEEKVTAPTCTEDGYTTYTCSACNKTYTGNTTAALGHTENAVVTFPDCENAGYTTYTCTVCGATRTGDETAAKGHTPGAEADCENAQTCTVCGDELVPAKGHSYKETVTAPTFDAEGYTTYTCSACGDSYKAEFTPAKVAVATVDGVRYETIEAAIEAAKNDGTVVLVKDVELTQSIVIDGVEYNVTLDLAGHTINASYEAEIVEVLLVKNGAKVRITGNGQMLATGEGDYVEVISVVYGAKVTIENGRFISDGCTAIFARYDDAEVIINGGYFEAKEPYDGVLYLLDVHTESDDDNTITAKIVVRGGEFVNYDPANHNNDGAYTNKVADGFHSVKNGNNYTVSAHSYKAVVTAPTCTKDGYTTYTCSVCDHSYTEAGAPATGHSFGEWRTTNAPTCTEDGAKRRNCDNCDAYETETISATGHSYTPKVTDPTCTEDGYTTYTCACGHSYTEAGAPATGHSFGEWRTTNAPTCTEDGAKRRDCDNCDAYETGTISATGHSYTPKVTDPTCTEDGYTTYTCACGHSYVANETEALGHDDSDNDHKCDACEEVISACADVDPCDHNCDVCGASMTRCLDKNYDHYCDICNEKISECADNDNDHECDTCYLSVSDCQDKNNNHKCDICNATLSKCKDEEKDHFCDICGIQNSHCMEVTTPDHICDWCGEKMSECVGGTPVTENAVGATCTTDGSYDKVTYCTVCGEEMSRETVPVEATGHKNTTTTTKPATCTTAGSTVVKCACGVTVSTTTIPKKGHTEVTVAGKAATCTKTGLTDGKKCSVCGITTVAQTTIPATGHVNTTTTTTPATCTKPGSTVVKCACGITVSTTEIPATGHVNTSESVTTAPTCTEKGSKAEICDACGVTVSTAEIPALGHDIVIDEAVDATCTQTGLTAGSHCSRCDDATLSQEVVAATGHKWVDATCEAPKTCSECGETEGDVLEHTYDSIFDKSCNACGATREGATEGGVEETGNMWTRVMETIVNFFSGIINFILSLFK